MSDESLSALLDGECSPAELDRLLDAMDRDPRIKDQFSRMCLARETQHATRWQRADLGFASRVMAAIDREPGESRVVAFPARGASFWRPVAGLAMAAGLAAVAILAIRPGPDGQPVSPSDVAVLDGAGTSAAQTDRSYSNLPVAYARQLDGLLMAHGKSRAQQGMGGTLGYARYAAYTTGQGTRDSGR